MVCHLFGVKPSSQPVLAYCWTTGSKFCEIRINIWGFQFKELHLKISSAKCHPFCQCVNGHSTGENSMLGLRPLLYQVWLINSSWPHAFARIMARERRVAHGPNSRDCWSPGEPARVQPPFPQDIWTLSCSVIRLALIGAGVLARIWSISNN